MKNLFNLDIDQIKYDNKEIKLIKLNGDIIYEKVPYYVPYEFRGQTSLIEVETMVRKRHTNLSYMFYNCKKLEQINTTDFDTSNVTSMSYMFNLCIALPELDVSNFVTNKVKNMSGMFADCDSLIELDVSNFDVSNVTHMSEMFGYCNKLETLDLRNWHLSDGTIIGEMFQGCRSLHTLRLDNCDLNTIKCLLNYPYGIYYEDGYSSYFPTGTIEGVTRTIYCKRAVVGALHPPTGWVFNYIDIEGIPLYESGKFNNNRTITEAITMVDESHDNLSGMFYNCTSLISVNTEDWDTSNVGTMYNMFANCTSLTELDLSNFDTSNVMSMQSMFYDCRSLTSLDVSNFDTSNVTDMGGMFANCTSLTELDLSNFNTSNVTDMQAMFDDCQSLTSLNLSNFDMSKTTYRNDMLRMCISLHTLRLDNCNNTTISKIINSLSFSINAIEGVTRTIYCKESEAAGLTAPTNWQFSFI